MTEDADTVPPGSNPPHEQELQVFANIVRQVVREEQEPLTQVVGSLRSAVAHLSDQRNRDRADQQARDEDTQRRLDEHAQRFELLERERGSRSQFILLTVVVAIIAVISLATSGVAISNSILIRSLIERLPIATETLQ